MRSGGIAPPLLTSILDGVEWSASRPGRGKSSRYPLDKRLDPSVDLDAVEYRKISCLCGESNHRRPARTNTD
jgi:hypothetical protein